MDQRTVFDADLIRRYDQAGPRYTSYPTAVQFHAGFGEVDYRRNAAASNRAEAPRPLSLYVHVPFCDTVCFYCACNKVVTRNRKRAGPYLERVRRELELQAALFDTARPVEQLHWGGGTPTFLSHAEMSGLMEGIGQCFGLLDDDRGEYSIEIDPREANRDTVRVLRELGFNRMSLGVQDFDPQVQKAVNRLQSEEQTWQVLQAAREYGFRSVSLDLIYGLALQTVESFARTLKAVIAASPDRLSVFNYAHLPQQFKTQRRINPAHLPSPEEKLRILGYTIDALTEAGYVYIGMDHFARPRDELAVAQREGTLQRNFQGYSTHAGCDLVALGMTGIGMVGDCYAQNARTLEEYYERIDAGRLAVARGFELGAEDRLRRRVISELICNFELDTVRLGDAFGVDFARHFARELQALRPMEDDGLLEIEPNALRVLPRGRMLIRNICMVFDAYLHSGAERRHSRVI